MLGTRSNVDNPSNSIETFESEMVPNDLAITETEAVVNVEHSPINTTTFGQTNEEPIANESRVPAGSSTSTNEEAQEAATKEANSNTTQDQSVGRKTQDFEPKELQKIAKDVGENIQEC